MLRVVAFIVAVIVLLKLIDRTIQSVMCYTREARHSKRATVAIHVLVYSMVSSVNSMAFATLNVVLLHYGL